MTLLSFPRRRETKKSETIFCQKKLLWKNRLDIFGIQEALVFFENNFGDVKNRVGNEKCAEHINRIMEVRQKHDYGENNRGNDKGVAQKTIFPKNQRHQKRQTGMTREKQITTESEITDDAGRIDFHVRRKRTDVRDGDENRAYEHEKRDAFERERYDSGFRQTQNSDKNPKQNRSIDE